MNDLDFDEEVDEYGEEEIEAEYEDYHNYGAINN